MTTGRGQRARDGTAARAGGARPGEGRSAGPGTALLLAVLAAAGLAWPVGASAQSVPGDYVRQFFGAVHMGPDEMPWAETLGAAWSRNGISWPNHEPEPGRYDFAAADSLVQAARRRSVRLMPVLSNVPPWASTAPEGTPNAKHHPFGEEHVDRWRAYVDSVVSRYPDVEYFEVWNEPNIDWFLATDRNHRLYVERILEPAAEVIHAHGRKVVAPSYTLEWPKDRWPPSERPARSQRNLADAIEDVDRWLGYRDAWRHIDVLSVHYSKGDARPEGVPSGDVLMPFYDHVYENWIEPGRLEGVWNTEEGLTATEAGTAGFVALEPWERPPYGQWVARYTLPLLHWAIRHGWDEPQQYKVFWYHITTSGGSGTLSPTNLLTREPAGEEAAAVERGSGGLRLSETGRALRVVTGLFEGADRVGVFGGDVRVGLGLSPEDPDAPNRFPAYEFTSYAFRVDDDLLVAAWVDLPGMTLPGPGVPGVEVEVTGPGTAGGGPAAYEARRVDYLTGETVPVGRVETDGGTLRLELARTGDPVLFLRLERLDAAVGK